MTQLLSNLQPYDALAEVVRHQLECWPEHESYLGKRFFENDPDFLSRVNEYAGLALALMGDEVKDYCEDYKWMCDKFNEEEIYFRRHKKYRLSTFKEAYENVYNDAAYMKRYVNCVFLSQMFWDNHARAFDIFRTEFLANLKPNSDYLEIGPGHGLFLYNSTKSKNIKSLTGFDISPASIAATTNAIKKLGVDSSRVNLIEQDILKAPEQESAFDVAVISEVLEHLEEPAKALEFLHRSLRTDGKIFINIPINSPAPDHIYLCTTTEEVTQLIEDGGFSIDKAFYLPMTGYGLEKALKWQVTVSCVILATKK